MTPFKEHIWEIDGHLSAAMDQIKETLLQEHPAGSGDQLVAISNKITEARHLLVDWLYK